MIVVDRLSVFKIRLDKDMPSIAPFLTLWTCWESLWIRLLWAVAVREICALGFRHVVESTADVSCYPLRPGHWLLWNDKMRPVNALDCLPVEGMKNAVWIRLSLEKVAVVRAINFRCKNGRSYLLLTKGLSISQMLSALVHEAGHTALDRQGDTLLEREHRIFSFEAAVLKAIAKRPYGKLLPGLSRRLKEASESANWYLEGGLSQICSIA